MKKTPLAYTYEYLIEDVLGLQEIELVTEKQSISLVYAGKTLELRSDFLTHCLNLNQKDKPHQPLKQLDLSPYQIFDSLRERSIPIIFGTDTINISHDKIELGLDIFGSCFLMLSRWEEYVKSNRDTHDRFPASASLAYQEGFIERPIVDEYVEILWCCIHHLWPELERKEHHFKQYVSCDVDFLRLNHRNPLQLVKNMAGAIILRRDFVGAWSRLAHFLRGVNSSDTFDFMMDVCEANKLKQAYYFIAREHKQAIDGDYNILDKRVVALIKKIRDRGHEIGLHPSYFTYLDRDKSLEEVQLLSQAIEQASGKANEIKGGRQHYLRWNTPTTASNWEAMGMQYDSTLGYAGHIGFRCGTCREYPFYNLDTQSEMKLKIRPLLVMDATILTEQYMGLTDEEAFARVKHLKEICRAYKGNFSLLWHNTFFEKKRYFKLYRQIVQA